LGYPIAEVVSDYQITTSKEELASLFEMPAGDILAARYFACLNEGKNIFVPQYGMWFQWNGCYWKQDNHGGMDVAKKTSDQFLKHTSDLFKTDPQRYKPYINFASQLRNKGRLDCMLALAASEPSISVDSSVLDKNTLLLGVPNGVVDLPHGKLLPPSSDHYITQQAGYAFNENAQCPNWLKFLNAVFRGDQSIITFIQVALGYTLTGSNTEELIFILYGNGANGKSVFGNVVAKILGSYGITGDSSVLVSQKPDTGPSSEMARYSGKRYVSFNETAAGNKLDARAVKVLAGREPIVARHLYQKAFEFTPQFTPWLRTNHKPIVTDTDDGIWRRLVLIPCKAVFTGANNDPNIESLLLSEGEGILRWIVEGAKIWCKAGLQIPSIIAGEVKIYRSDSDLFGEFLSDNIKRVTVGRTEQNLVWSRYLIWCHSENTHLGTKASFTRRLAECGYPAVKSNGKRYYQGLELS
jgi:P4 family phage/plasmid primase-like protien